MQIQYSRTDIFPRFLKIMTKNFKTSVNKTKQNWHRLKLPFVAVLSVIVAAVYADVTVPYSVPQESRVSLALYNKDGQLVRARLTGLPPAMGRHTESCDGLDRYANAPPAGEYSKAKTSQALWVLWQITCPR